MKISISLITIFIFCVIFSSCSDNNRIEALQKEVDNYKKIVAQNQVSSPAYGIAYRKTTKPGDVIVKLNVIYTYKTGPELQETLTFNLNDPEYNYHTFLTDCSKKLGNPQITFYAMGKSAGTAEVKYILIPADNMPHKLTADQGDGYPDADVSITINTAQRTMCAGKGKCSEVTALFTIDIN